MRWKGRRQSENVEDRRSAAPVLVGGGLMAIVLAVIVVLMGGDPAPLLDNVGQQAAVPAGPAAATGAQDEMSEFVRVVLADTEDVWHAIFQDQGRTYKEPHLVLFTGSVRSACGFTNAAVGPFYCPADGKLYIDLSFYEELRSRFHAPGDFAQAYVIAHEVGHHVQNLLGISNQVNAMRGQLSDEEFNELSVRMELQADFFAGVWAHHAQKMKGILERGDLEEALNAASAIGDDRLQMQAQGYVVPESFTHGTSAQRAKWFSLGLKTGEMSQGDTFSARNL